MIKSLFIIIYCFYLGVADAHVRVVPSYYYHYENFKIKITDTRYTRYILPQMHNIIKDFQFLFIGINQDKQVLVKSVLNLFYFKIYFNKTKFVSENFKNNNNSSQINLKHLNRICYNLLSFYNDTIQVISKNKINIYYIQSLKQLSFDCLNVVNVLDLQFLNKNISTSLYRKISIQNANAISRLFETSLYSLTLALPDNIKSTFKKIIRNFYFPLASIYQKRKNGKMDYIKNLDTLNRYINIFVMEIEKINKKYLPDSYVKRIKTILRRWNSLQKVLLHR